MSVSVLTYIQDEPSVFALLVDNISKMSTSEQKLLWMKLNKEKIESLAVEIDGETLPSNLTEDEINTLVKDARAYGRKKS